MTEQLDGWTAAILAGGSARRLGGLRKTDLSVDGEPILERQRRALAAVPARVYLVCQDPLPYRDRGITVLTDLREHAGPLGGVYTALRSTGADRVLVLACDLPFLTTPFLAWLLHRAHEGDVTVPSAEGRLHPLCAVYAATCLPAIEACLSEGTLAMRDLLSRVRVHRIDHAEFQAFDPDNRLLFNVNTPDDYARACRLLRPDAERGMLSHGSDAVKLV